MTHTVGKSIACIAKSVDMRPSTVYIVALDGEKATIQSAPEDCDRPLVVPRHLLFNMDPDLFDRLKKAWVRGEKNTLRKLWSMATPWTEKQVIFP